MNLSDTQLIILSTAAQRDDLRIVLPERLRGGAAEKVLATLLGKGLIEMVPEEEIMPPALGDEAPSPAPYRITTVGLAAIGLGAEGSDESTSPSSEPEAVAPAAPAGAKPPRPGSKLALVISLLERPDGASLAELVVATGWLPHTTRAALTGLRKRGLALERRKRADGTSIYAIPSASEIA